MGLILTALTFALAGCQRMARHEQEEATGRLALSSVGDSEGLMLLTGLQGNEVIALQLVNTSEESVRLESASAQVWVHRVWSTGAMNSQHVRQGLLLSKDTELKPAERISFVISSVKPLLDNPDEARIGVSVSVLVRSQVRSWRVVLITNTMAINGPAVLPPLAAPTTASAE